MITSPPQVPSLDFMPLVGAALEKISTAAPGSEGSVTHIEQQVYNASEAIKQLDLIHLNNQQLQDRILLLEKVVAEKRRNAGSIEF